MPDSTLLPNSGHERERQLAHLASSVGHHVINAFSAVVSNAEILKYSGSAVDESELAETADLIVNVSLKASGVARRLIDFTRPSTHPLDQQVDFFPLIKEVVDEFSRDYPQVSWTVDLREGTRLKGDPDQLRSMFGYLLLNAIEALPLSQGEISVRTFIEDPEWSSILIEDNGLGMDAMIREQALEPFFSTKTGHLGIGLCLANSIWRRHGGTLSILSRPGKGTTLRMTYNLGTDFKLQPR